MLCDGVEKGRSEFPEIEQRLQVSGWLGDGGREGIRTLDLSVANAALSQLSYAPTLSEI